METKTKKSLDVKKSKKSTLEKKKVAKDLSKKKLGVKEITKKASPVKKLVVSEEEEKIKKKKNLIKESKLNLVKVAKISESDGNDEEKKKKKTRRHKKNTSLGFKTRTKLLNRPVKTLEAAEKLAEKKLENLKELRAKRKNKLFVACKKKIAGDLQIKALHPNIKSVIFPRKKSPKYCWISFETAKKANEAYETLKDEKEYLIQKPKTNVNNINVKDKAKELFERSQKKLKKKALAQSWS